jgi:RNA-directed DNA polymerase
MEAGRRRVEELLLRGHPEVVDADLADYFGSIPHADLLKSVARRVVDRRVLHLIKMWLDCPVEETDDRGWKTRTTEARDTRRGIPQGSPPLTTAGESLHAPVCAGVEEARP